MTVHHLLDAIGKDFDAPVIKWKESLMKMLDTEEHVHVHIILVIQ